MSNKDADFSTKGIIDVKKHRRLGRKYWLLTYFDDDLSIKKNIKYITSKLIDFPNILNFVFQIEKDDKGYHSHIAIELKNSTCKPVPQFDKRFPKAKIQYIDDIQAAREYCSKKYSRCSEYEPIFFGLKDEEKEKLILEGKKEKDIKLLQESVEREVAKDTEKITSQSRVKCAKFRTEDLGKIENNRSNLKVAAKRKEKAVKKLEEAILENDKIIEYYERDITKVKREKTKLIKKQKETKNNMIELAKQIKKIEDETQKKIIIFKRDKLITINRQLEDDIQKENKKIEFHEGNIIDTQENTSYLKEKINGYIDGNLTEFLPGYSENEEDEKDTAKDQKSEKISIFRETMDEIKDKKSKNIITNIVEKMPDQSEEDNKESEKCEEDIKVIHFKEIKTENTIIQNTKKEEAIKLNKTSMGIEEKEKLMKDISTLKSQLEAAKASANEEDIKCEEREKEIKVLEKKHKEDIKERDNIIAKLKEEYEDKLKEHDNIIVNLNKKHDDIVKDLKRELSRCKEAELKRGKTEYLKVEK